MEELEERGWTVLQDALDHAAVLNAREAALKLVRRASYSGPAAVCCNVQYISCVKAVCIPFETLN